MSKFKVGDKVKILDGSKIKDYAGNWVKETMGKRVGEVHKIANIHEKFGDSPYAAYNLDIDGFDRVLRWDERGLKLVSKFKYEDSADQKIVITTDGKTTTAVLYDGKKRIKDAKATCAPTDTFDFGIGSALAIERLMGNSKATLPENEKSSLDWNKFAHGELEVKVSKEKYDELMKLCEERNFKWISCDSAIEWNPWKAYDEMPVFIKAIIEAFHDIPDEYVWVSFDNKADTLKFGTKRDEDLDEYEFV